MEHRTTVWRWKTGKSIPRGKRKCRTVRERVWNGQIQKYYPVDWRGRRTRASDTWARNALLRVACLLEERGHSSFVDHNAVLSELPARRKRDEVRAIFSELLLLRSDGIAADLMRMACFDFLRLGVRHRRPSRKQLNDRFWADGKNERGEVESAFVKRLRKAAPYLTKSQAEELIESARKKPDGFAWITKILEPQPGSIGDENVSENRPCVSTVFHGLNRKLAYYWRNHRNYRQILKKFAELSVV
jgi:hypothetical protein